MLHTVLQCLNGYEPMLRREMATASSPCNRLFERLDSDYIMTLIIVDTAVIPAGMRSFLRGYVNYFSSPAAFFFNESGKPSQIVCRIRSMLVLPLQYTLAAPVVFLICSAW